MPVKHTYKVATGTKTSDNFTPMKAIRQKCYDCSCWNYIEIENCTVIDCALYPFRSGKNPSLKGLRTNLGDSIGLRAGREKMRKLREARQAEKDNL